MFFIVSERRSVSRSSGILGLKILERDSNLMRKWEIEFAKNDNILIDSDS
jgi:hypothetical protein